MARQVNINEQDDIVSVYGNDRKRNEQPSVRLDLVSKTSSGGEPSGTISIDLDIGTYDCVVLADWINGKPFWDPSKFNKGDNLDDQLYGLLEIYGQCVGVWKDEEAANACMDSLIQLLDNGDFVLDRPLDVLFEYMRYDCIYRMVPDVVVNGKCATDGRAVDWIDDIFHSDRTYSQLLAHLAFDFAIRTRGGKAFSDPLRPGAWHWDKETDDTKGDAW